MTPLEQAFLRLWELSVSSPAHSARGHRRSASEQRKAISHDSRQAITHWPPLVKRIVRAAGPELRRLAQAACESAQQGRRLIAMAGQGRGDGCTTMTLALAQALGQILAGKSVVVVDAHWESADAGKLLGIPDRAGLWDVIQGRVGFKETIFWSSEQNVAVLPAGKRRNGADEMALSETLKSGLPPRPVRNPPPLRNSLSSVENDQLTHLFRQLRLSYEIVLIDSGPLRDGKDFNLAASAVDAMILVEGPNGTWGHSHTIAEHQAGDQQPPILAVIKNRMSEARAA